MAGRYAVLIGCTSFQDSEQHALLAPPEDIDALKSLLRNPEIGGFEQRDVLQFMDASLTTIQGAIEWLYSNREPEDLTLLYYTGHGYVDDRSHLYLALAETKAQSFSVGSLSAAELLSRMNRSASRRQVVLIDSCYSGAIENALLPGTISKGAKVVTQAHFDPVGYGRYVVTSSNSTQPSYASDALYDGAIAPQTSVFTRHLVDGIMSGEAARAAHQVSVSDLHRYACRRAREDGWSQEPQLFGDAEPGNTYIANNPNPRKPLPEGIDKALWNEENIVEREWAALKLAAFAADPDDYRAEDALALLRHREPHEKMRGAAQIIESAIERAESGAKSVERFSKIEAEVVESEAKIIKSERQARRKLIQIRRWLTAVATLLAIISSIAMVDLVFHPDLLRFGRDYTEQEEYNFDENLALLKMRLDSVKAEILKRAANIDKTEGEIGELAAELDRLLASELAADANLANASHELTGLAANASDADRLEANDRVVVAQEAANMARSTRAAAKQKLATLERSVDASKFALEQVLADIKPRMSGVVESLYRASRGRFDTLVDWLSSAATRARALASLPQQRPTIIHISDEAYAQMVAELRSQANPVAIRYVLLEQLQPYGSRHGPESRDNDFDRNLDAVYELVRRKIH